MFIHTNLEKCPVCGEKNLLLHSNPIIEKITWSGMFSREPDPDAGKEFYVSRGNDYKLTCLSCGRKFVNHPIIIKILKKLQKIMGKKK